MIKDNKIFELRIEEDDEISGIDSVSLVSEPAIEINWVAFKKEVQENFDIPDGEDEKYIQILMAKGQPEQDFLNEGWAIHSIQAVGKDSFATSPNETSEFDEDEYQVRYKYMLQPYINESSIIPTTRQFCKHLVNKNYVWRVEEMDSLVNDFGSPAIVWRGGYNCRHVWSKILYKKDATIVNKASVNKGKLTDGDFPTDMNPDLSILGYPQPSTVTEKTLGNPSPSTIRNLGLSKEAFNAIDIYGFKPRYFHMCPGAVATFEHLISMDNDEDTIGMIRSAAQVADNVFRIEEEVLKSKIATPEQFIEAMVLVQDFKDIIHEVDEITMMVHDVSYMDGHIEKIKEYVQEDMGYDVGTITGYVNPGITGSTKQKFESYSDYPDSVKNNAKAVLKYAEENGWGSCGTDVGKQRANQLANGEAISEDTIRRMYSYLSRHEVDLDSSKGYGDGCGKLMYDAWGGKSALSWAEAKIKSIEREKMSKQIFADEDKRTIIGPAMVPDMKIYRKDPMGNPYHVFFSAETIKMIAEKYMRNKYLDNNDTEHDGKAVRDVYVVESWIKETNEDKANAYGFKDVPVGSWFIKMKVAKTPQGDLVWEKIKKKELNGFSVSGWFEEIRKFEREEMLLHKINEILSKITE